MAHAGGLVGDVDLLRLIDLLGFALLQMVGRELHLDDMRAQQRRHMRRVSAHIDGQLAGLRQRFAARIGPDHGGDAVGFRLAAHLRDLLEQFDAGRGARIDREADRGAAEPQRVLDAGGDRLILRRVARHQRVGGVHFQDGGNLAGEGVGAGLQRAQRRGVGVQARVDRHLIVVMRIIAGRVRREAAGRAVLEALIDRQDDHLAGAAQLALHQNPAQIGLHARGVGLVVGKDLLDVSGDPHRSLFLVSGPVSADRAVFSRKADAAAPRASFRQSWLTDGSRLAVLR